jgi:chaperone BCS1
MDMMSTQSAQHGMIRALRTGNVMLDTLLALIVPVLFGLICRFNKHGIDYIKKWINSYYSTPRIVRLEHVRVIECSTSQKSDSGVRNMLLQRSVIMYLEKVIDWTQLHVTAKYELRAVKDDSVEKIKNGRYVTEYGTTLQQLQKYKRYTAPPENMWITVSNGVDLMISTVDLKTTDANGVVKSDGSQMTTIKLKSTATDGLIKVNTFVDNAFTWYCSLMSLEEDNRRFMYTPVIHDFVVAPNTPSSIKTRFKRYALSDEKTFETLFFQEKQQILKLLHNFEHKLDKYAIKGYPKKLGILLHGPPGTGMHAHGLLISCSETRTQHHLVVDLIDTGKTSFIKALAQKTNRNIVSIPLSRISTNQDLMDMVFDGKYHLEGGGYQSNGLNVPPIALGFDQTVFVLEDIDAASDVVHAREPAEAVDECKTQSDTTLAETEKVVYRFPSPKDKLNLAGILNVIDGVVDSPSRIIVMTTNHPEKLDPALIRPGRVDIKLLLGYMTHTDAQQLCEHYFNVTLNTKQIRELRTAFKSGTPSFSASSKNTVVCDRGPEYTPALLEQMCSEHDHVDSFIEAIVAKRHTS